MDVSRLKKELRLHWACITPIHIAKKVPQEDLFRVNSRVVQGKQARYMYTNYKREGGERKRETERERKRERGREREREREGERERETET